MTMIPGEQGRLQYALQQAELGHRTFPCHAVIAAACTCGKTDCRNPGKHPMVTGWQKIATTSEEEIRRLWLQHPTANIGIATGPGSDLLAVDIDVRGGNGFEHLANIDPRGLGWEGLETLKTRTGSGGGHLFFCWPQGARLGTKAKLGGLAIDYRGQGGQVIAPGSTNDRGAYRWELGPADAEKQHCPEWLLKFLLGAPEAPAQSSSGLKFTVQSDGDFAEHPGCGEGERNAELCRLTGKALAEGQAPEEILQAALRWNERCSPPQSRVDVEKAVLGILGAELRQRRPGLIPLPAPAANPHRKTTLIVRRAAEVEEEQLVWLWNQRFLLGHLNLLAGDPGLGKSLIAVDMAARVTTGRAWPDGSPCPEGEVMYATTEDHFAAVVRPRLTAAGADAARVHFLEGVTDMKGEEGAVFLDDHLPLINAFAESHPTVRLLILDTLQSFCGSETNTNNNASARRIMTPLKRFAEQRQIAVVALEHLTKAPTAGRTPFYRVQGSIAFAGAARAVWMVCRDPADENRRIVQAGKCNLAPAEGLGLSFTVSGEVGRPFIEWGDCNISTPIAELMGEQQSGGDGGGDRGQFEAVVEWLQHNLQAPQPAVEMQAGAKAEGFSAATLRRAKAHLGVSSRKTGDGWLWIPGPSVNIAGTVIANPMRPPETGQGVHSSK